MTFTHQKAIYPLSTSSFTTIAQVKQLTISLVQMVHIPNMNKILSPEAAGISFTASGKTTKDGT